MASPFTQALSMRNFLVVKKVPSDEPPHSPTGRSNSSSSNSNGGSRRNSCGSNGNSISRRHRDDSASRRNSANGSSDTEQAYKVLVKKSRQAIANNHQSAELGPYSCHEIGRNKSKVHFGEEVVHHLHSSCPIIDNEGMQPQRSLDLVSAAKQGISLSALPTTSDTTQTLLLRKEDIKNKDSNWIVESIRGDRLATIDGEAESIVLQYPTSTPADRRLVQDMEGNIYAVLLRVFSGDGKNLFRICGVERLYEDQRKSRETGLYTYAEVKNTGSIGVKISMKVRGEAAKKYVTEFFGPSIFKWGRSRPRGLLIKNQEGTECARITILGGAKAISVEPHVDVRLMTCFAAIINEMVEKRMR